MQGWQAALIKNGATLVNFVINYDLHDRGFKSLLLLLLC